MPGSNPGSETANSPLTVRGAVAVLMVYIFAFFFGVSLGPISWNVCSEIFPSRLNAKCCMVTTCTQWLFQIVIAAITPLLLASVGAWTFVVYGVCCVLSLVWCAFCVPETRNVPLGREMDAVFGGGKDDSAGEVEEVEDVSEETPLIAARNWRRRSSVAIVV
jgi:Sugar (and other) transporter